MHSATFQYRKPTEDQAERMPAVSGEAEYFCHLLLTQLPDGPDEIYAVRKLREVVVWANVAIARRADGTPPIESLPAIVNDERS